ncbi:ATP-binding protein [Sphingomonas sp. HF-S4]|uniref:histidine kinase n=1 Tax=Sphingomonas agrestis TaxID=3080540 RepID=A0ABU3Y867_9SPHN|nr:ATP-binding protein [Sphingomonas sp. HF-S4]MDV3457608.1 ATP-binding protein [Sphingomonas sp. HF-S4]
MERLEQLESADLQTRRVLLRRICIFAAAASSLISTAIFCGWLSFSMPLARAVPLAFEMRPNAALGFAALGLALLALQRDRMRLGFACALFATFVGGATILEYFGAPFSIDSLAVRDWSGTHSPYPGRVAPNTATVLTLLGVALAILTRSKDRHTHVLVAQFVPLAALALVFEAVAGHLGQSSFAASWWAPQAMSFPSIVCALCVGTGLIAYSWQFETAKISRVPLWVPPIYCFLVALVDVYTPLEVNAGILYIPLVLFAWWFERAQTAILLAGFASILILLGLFSSPRGHIPLEIVLVNRGLAIGSVWVVAALVYAQHRVRKRLRQSEHHFAVAQQIADVGSFELHFADRRLRTSDAFAAMHGLAPQTPANWDDFLRTAVPPDERPAIEEMLATAQQGTRSRDLDYSFVRPDGTVRNALMHCDLLYDAAGQPAGIIGVVHDVTEVKRARVRAADLEGQLRHAQKLEALGTLAGSIAHDMNNTLVPITTLAPLLMETAEPSDRHVLEIMLKAARRAKELVREMLVFSRKDESEPERFCLDQLVAEALVILRAGVPTNIAIVEDMVPVPEILGRKGQIYQAILNLVTNAAQAIGDRVGTITIGVAAEFTAGAHPSEVRLFVADDGPGMPPEVSQRIFEPYFSTKTASTGTGLGLAIVNGIVTGHEGEILVRSVVGEGTRFDLLFPPHIPAAASQGD